jgi:hypothetical protein
MHHLADHPIVEIAERRRQTLEGAGLGTLEALAAADPATVAALPGFHPALALRVIARAAAAVPTTTKKPGRKKRKRIVAQVVDKLGEARRHAAAASGKGRRKRARASLATARERMDALMGAIDDGVLTASEWAQAARVVSTLDERLDRFLDGKPKKSRVEEVAEAADSAAESLPGRARESSAFHK